MDSSFGDRWDDIWRELWRWDLLPGAAAFGGAIISLGQAVAGNGADEWTFSFVAIVLLAVAVALLARASRFVRPATVSLVVALYVSGSMDDWHLPWWARWGAWLVIVIAVHFLASRRHETFHRKGGSEAASAPSAVGG